MRALGVIPARYASSRFPGKPLAPIAGQPMIRRVYEAARKARSLQALLVATDDPRIAEVCAGFGAEVALTRADHPSGSHRVHEASTGYDAEVVVNIQGDEPLIEGFVIDAAVEALQADREAPMATVIHALEAGAEDDPNRVKVVLDQRQRALYFSRSPLPYLRNSTDPPTPRWQHVGLYAYRRDFLECFVELEATPAERAEGLEQLRVLEHGHAIHCAVIEGWQSVPIDVPGDVDRVEALLRERSGVR